MDTFSVYLLGDGLGDCVSKMMQLSDYHVIQ